MTREQALKDPEMAAAILCDLVQETMWTAEQESDGSSLVPFACKVCPAAKFCKVGRNGFYVWLQKEDEVNG